MPSSDVNTFQGLLSRSKHIIAVAGAGLSAASGIPTFRGAGGLWRKYDAMSIATPEAFEENPSQVWQFYHYRREIALQKFPNAAHKALANFSLPHFRNTISSDSTFTLITQNVDGLSQRALDEMLEHHPQQEQPSQPYILEMHGRLFDVKCSTPDCGHVEWNAESPICRALAGTERLVDVGTTEPRIAERELPRCSQCGSLARPGVVWFGEVPLHMGLINQLVDHADLCLVIGTSSTVYPAAGYASIVQDNGGKVAVFNLDRSEGDEEADFLFLGPCEETIPEVLSMPTEA